MTTLRMNKLVAMVVCLMFCTSHGSADDHSFRTEQVTLGEKYTIHSTILGDDRSFIVKLPDGYESSAVRYPVLYILDAEYFYYQAYGALQFLSECGYNTNRPVPQMILVGLLDGDRNRDFTPTHAPVQGPLRFPTSGEAVTYLQHLEKELRPFIDARFRTSGSILAGWSLGGLFAFFTFLEEPDLFSAYIAISPSLWWNDQEPLAWAEERIQKKARFAQRLVITQGSLEGGNIGSSVKGGIVPLLKRKKATGWQYVEIPGVSHYYVPYKAIYEGLNAAFPGFALPQSELMEGPVAVKKHYEMLSRTYGYDLDVPESAYAALVRTWFGSRDPEEILPVTTEWTSAYPRSALAWYFLGHLHRLSNELEKADVYFEKALALEQSRMLPDSEWLVPMTNQLKKLPD